MKHAVLLSLLFSYLTFHAQISIDYSNPRKYEIGGITVSGATFTDAEIIILLSTLRVGQQISIPGDEISNAIKNIWKQGLFSTVDIYVVSTTGNYVFLNIHVSERPRISNYAIRGVSRSESSSLQEKLKIQKNDVLTDNLLLNSMRIIKNHFYSKGFMNVEVTYKTTIDTTAPNAVLLDFLVKKNQKVKIQSIQFEGNAQLKDRVLRRQMKHTKEKKFWRVWKASRFEEEKFQQDKNKIIEKYHNEGFRDAHLISDTIIKVDDRHISIRLTISEGNKFYIRNIEWIGNTKYPDDTLSQIFRLKKGDVYNQRLIDTYLYMSPDGRDIHSLYMDNGYLFFSARLVEHVVGQDSIDLKIYIYEGERAYINRVSVSGNTRTHDKVIMREIRSRPGQLFSRSDIIRTQRELLQLRYFNQETMNVDIRPNPSDGTVDIEYIVEEQSTDQLELSGGWGLGRLVGTVGVSLNNFSIRNVFNRSAWRPIPSGDGQTLSLRAQSNGSFFQAYNLAFTEPWLGGKKPNALTIALYHSLQSNGVSKKQDGTVNDYGVLLKRAYIKITGLSIGLGMRMKWPDDYFISYFSVNFQRYNVKDFDIFLFQSGFSNNINVNYTLSRNSIDAPIYPRRGSDISISVQMTPPYSLFIHKDWNEATDQEKYKWLEYHKTKFNASFFTRLAGNLVLNNRIRYGFLGYYNKNIGLSPFERFYLGGDGLSGFALDGRELIGMRGYQNNSLTPVNNRGNMIGGTIFSKYTFELRYPLSLNPMASIYVLAFVEAGNAWADFSTFNPFDVHRSAGVGVRLYMPFFGLLGLDWGYGFDPIPNMPGAHKGQIHFSINNSID